MKAASSYSVTQERDGSYSLHSSGPPLSRVVASIAPVKDRTDQVLGWRLKPLVVMQGAKSRLWTTPDEAIIATKLMTPGQARAAVRAAGTTDDQSIGQ